MRRFNPRKSNPEPRWRQQNVHRTPQNRCRQCGKLYYTRIEDAVAMATQLTQVHNQEHFVYRHHGMVHLTTQPQG